MNHIRAHSPRYQSSSLAPASALPLSTIYMDSIDPDGQRPGLTSLGSCVTLGKPPNISEPQSLWQ